MRGVAELTDHLGGRPGTTGVPALTSIDIDANVGTGGSALGVAMRSVTMTEFKQRASRILDEREPTAILRHGKVEGYYVPAQFLASRPWTTAA